MFEYANYGFDPRAVGQAALAVIELITGLRSRSKATSALIAGSFTPRPAPAGGESGRPPGIPAFGKGLLGVPRGGSRVVVVLRVHDRRFVPLVVVAHESMGCQAVRWRFFVPRSHAGGLPMQWPVGALRWRGTRPSRAPFVCIEIWAFWETNFFEQTLLLGARRPA